jgi:hypothetical protein
MPIRPTGSAVVVLAALTLAVTAASPRPAEAFFFLPMIYQYQPIDSRQQHGRGPSDNKWRDESAKPIKPSTTTRSRDEDDDDDEPSSSSAGKGVRSSAKSEAKRNSSEAKSNSGQTSRSSGAKQEPPASKSSSHAKQER